MKNNNKKITNVLNNFTRKSILKKGGYAVLISMMFSTNMVYALDNKTQGYNSALENNVQSQNISKKDSTRAFESDLKEEEKYKYETSDNKEPKGIVKNRLNAPSPVSDEEITVSGLSRLNYSNMIQKIKNMNSSDIGQFFKFDGNTNNFYSDKNRVQALIDAFNKSAQKFTKDNDEGIVNLVEVIRAGFYLGYYNESLSFLNERTYKDKCIEGMKNIENNSAFGLGTATQNSVVSALGSIIGNGTIDADAINGLAPLFKQFKDNFNEFSVDKNKAGAVKQVLEGIQYYLNTMKYSIDVKETELYGKIDIFLNAMGNVCLTESNKINNGNEYIINEFINRFSELGVYSKNTGDILKVLEDIMNKYEYASYQYIQVASKIQENYDGKDSKGSDIDYDKIIEAGKNKFLPKTYKFDNDKIIVKAGDKVSEEKIQRLYWASKEVKAQFLRMVQNDKPFEEGNADEVLTIVIYNSPAEYKLNTKLYGYDTNNGGMYIEPRGTFFTYERTTQESIYTLEELFRHEFTHYLQGRYLVPGMWGNGEFYKNNELTWFEEGTAEFFAGSTRTEGVKPRGSVVTGISADRTKRMRISELVNSKYGSWDFYNYGWGFASYMYKNDLGSFNTILNYIKSNNALAYRNYMRQLGGDYSLNNYYQKYLDDIVSNIDSLGVPLVSDYYTSDTEYKDAEEVYSEIEKTAKLTNVAKTEEKSQYFNTFDLKGTFEGGRSAGNANDLKDINEKVDDILKELSKKDWSGYKTVTAYFLNHRINKNGNYEYDVVFHGKLANDKSKNKTIKAGFVCNDTGIINKELIFDASKSICLDGKIKTYEWDFGDGHKQTTTDSKINHKYGEKGSYKVTLKVVSDNGKTDEGSSDINILKRDPKTSETKEKEPNNNVNDANQILGSDYKMVASLGKKDNDDYYTFTVEKKGDVKINLPKNNDIKLNWLLFKEGDNSNYISYQGKNSKDVMELEPGKYNLCVYNLDNNKNGNYELSINGFLKDFDEKTTETDEKTTGTDEKTTGTDEKTTGTDEKTTETDEKDKKVSYIYEKENNNIIKKANNIIGSDIPILGSLDNNDRDDYFKFTVTKRDKIKIEANKQNLNLNWIVYKEGDEYNYVMSPENLDDAIKGEKELDAGTYYIRAYYIGGGSRNSSYNIKVSGSIGELPEIK